YSHLFIAALPHHLSSSFLLCFCSHRLHRALHSFPTRRSSDLRHLYGGGGGHRRRRPDQERHPQASGTHHRQAPPLRGRGGGIRRDRKSTRLNSSHVSISYAVFCLKKKNTESTRRDAVKRRRRK